MRTFRIGECIGAEKQALEQSLHDFEAHATSSSGTDAMSRQLDDAQARLTAQIRAL